MPYRITVTQNPRTGELTYATARSVGFSRKIIRLKEVPDVPLDAEKKHGPKSITYQWSVKSLDMLSYTKINIICR